TGRITTVLGTGAPGTAGDGAPARSYPVDSPTGLVLDGYGNLFVASRTAIRRVAAEGGLADGSGAVASIYGAPPRDTYPASFTQCIAGLFLLPGSASLFATDSCTGMLLRLDRQ